LIAQAEGLAVDKKTVLAGFVLNGEIVAQEKSFCFIR